MQRAVATLRTFCKLQAEIKHVAQCEQTQNSTFYMKQDSIVIVTN